MVTKIKYKKISKSKGRNFCDELWSLLTRIKENMKCAICGKTEYCQSHHIISRRILRIRYDVKNNGINLCADCHKYNLINSAHTAPFNFFKWLEKNRTEQFNFFLSNKDDIKSEEIDYEQTYLKLEEQHKQMTGNYYKIERLTQYLLFKNIEFIKSKIKENKKISEIVQELNFVKLSEATLKTFIASNKKYIDN